MKVFERVRLLTPDEIHAEIPKYPNALTRKVLARL
jgi:hypothetical protein